MLLGTLIAFGLLIPCKFSSSLYISTVATTAKKLVSIFT